MAKIKSPRKLPQLVLTGDVFYLDIEDEEYVRFSPFNSRIHYPEQELINLGESIREHGQIHPVIVRPIYADGARFEKEGKPFLYFETVVGERRIRSLRLTYQPQSRATVWELTDAQAAQITLQENLKSKKLTDYEEALGIKKFWEVCEAAGMDIDPYKMGQLVKVEGDDGEEYAVGEKFIQNRMQLLDLRPELLEIAKHRRKVMSSLFEIAELDEIKDASLIETCITLVNAGQGIRSVRDAIVAAKAQQKSVRESVKAPDRETKQRTETFNQTNGKGHSGSMSRGRMITRGGGTKEAEGMVDDEFTLLETRISVLLADHLDGVSTSYREKTLPKKFKALRATIDEVEAKCAAQ